MGPPLLCEEDYAGDICDHKRAYEAENRPSTDFMERIQTDLNAHMRAKLIDWLVEVAEAYHLASDTLYLTVNYLDRYLSRNVVNREQLQLLGAACIMIASKYEELCVPKVEDFCYISTYSKRELLEMESSVLNFLNFQLAAPTIKCFLRRSLINGEGLELNQVSKHAVHNLTSYIAELSFMEYSMLWYTPSLIAASTIFLARFILSPSTKPWNLTLQQRTHYHPCDLCACVKDLHRLLRNSPYPKLTRIKEKYSQEKYYCVALVHCPPSLPQQIFIETAAQIQRKEGLDEFQFPRTAV